MDRVEILLAAITPGFLALAYGVTKTRGSWSNEALWTAFLLGGLGIAAALPIEIALKWLIGFASLSPLMNAAAVAFFEAAIVEETTKFFILFGGAETHVDARRRQDIIVLAVAVSLGFATVENFMYLLAPENWGVVGATRALTAVPGHGVDGLAMGALLTAARVRPNQRRMWLGLALGVPILMHAAYDFPIFVIRSHTLGPDTVPWVLALWCAMLLISSLIAIGLCNWILPVAKRADRASGRDIRTLAPVAPLISAGAILLAVALAFAAFFYRSKGVPGLVTGAAVTILPAVLAADLIWTGMRRAVNNRRSRESTQAMKRLIIG